MNLPEAEETLCAAIATGAVTSVEPELRVVLAACRQQRAEITDLRVRLRLAHDELDRLLPERPPIHLRGHHQHDVWRAEQLRYEEIMRDRREAS